MSNIDQILLETVRVAIAAVLGGLVGAKANDSLTRRRELQSRIKACKLEILPVLGEFIAKASAFPSPLIVHRECISTMKTLHSRLSIHLKGSKHLSSVNKAWKHLEDTTQAELAGTFNGVFDAKDEKQASELHKIQGMLVSRLKQLNDSIENA